MSSEHARTDEAGATAGRDGQGSEEVQVKQESVGNDALSDVDKEGRSEAVGVEAPSTDGNEEAERDVGDSAAAGGVSGLGLKDVPDKPSGSIEVC